MRKWMLAGVAALMVITAGPALAGNSRGGGAQKAPLTAATNSSNTDCSQGDPAAPAVGFAILNTAGKPGGADNKVVGEVSLKDGTPNTTYMVFLQKASDDCGNGGGIATLTTNNQGNGNAHIESLVAPLAGPGVYWVHLKGADMVDFASTPVTLD